MLHLCIATSEEGNKDTSQAPHRNKEAPQLEADSPEEDQESSDEAQVTVQRLEERGASQQGHPEGPSRLCSLR